MTHINLVLKEDNGQLVADAGPYRITLTEHDVANDTGKVLPEIVKIWGYEIHREGIRMCRGRSLEPDNQQAVLRTSAKMLAQFMSVEAILGECMACGAKTHPFNLARVEAPCPDCRTEEGKAPPACATCSNKRTTIKIMTDDAYYAARAKASKEFFGREIPDYLIYRCLDPACELHKQPQRRA